MTDLSFDWLPSTVFGVSTGSAITALAVALLAYVIFTTALRFALKRMSAISSRTSTRLDNTVVEILGSTNRALIVLVSVLIGVGFLDLPDRWAARVSQLWFVALAVQVALWANKAVTLGLQRHATRVGGSATAPASAAATLISWGLRTVLWTVLLLAMLSNLGVNVTAFIASLGVGGIAVALAAQNILGDLFASVAIAVDKPFEVGDFIVLGSIAGTVEVVGVKTTRIRSLGGEQIVMSNTELLKQTVSNYKRLQQRRIVFTFRLTYDTSADQLRQVPEIVQRIVTETDGVRFDRAHFKGFAESSLEFEVVYFVLDPSYNIYMDQQQRINLRLVEEMEKLGARFALPTRTVYMNMPERPAREEAEVPGNGVPAGAAAR